jgi:hypothetical protein
VLAPTIRAIRSLGIIRFDITPKVHHGGFVKCLFVTPILLS